MKKLYLIIRTDMASMTTGRIAAQSSHITDAFAQMVDECRINGEGGIATMVDDWRQQTTQNFGTVIVLNGGSEQDIMNLFSTMDESDWIVGTVTDPEYYIRDGSAVHIVPDVLVGMFAFPLSDDVSDLKGLDRL